MLQLKSIDKNTFNLLHELSTITELSNFALAGGTSLALRFGHRISVDLDFFTFDEFDSEFILQILQKHYTLSDVSLSNNSLNAFVHFNDKLVKVDFIRHAYPVLANPELINGIRFYPVKDIAAMKLNAVINRGAKKDFFDIYELLQHFSLVELIEFYERKYSQMNTMLLIKSLKYFVDAELHPDPVSLKNITWDEVKSFISNEVDKYLDEFLF